jgi:hypothetical protein
MADPNPNLKVIEPVVKKQSRFKNFIINHPRITAVVGVTVTTVLIAGMVSVLKDKNSETVALSSDSDLEELVQLESTLTA